jgi:hypothetical protein
MLTAKQFTAKIAQDCESLFQVHENSVKSYFDNKPSREEMIGYFSRRMINERINCIQLARRVSKCELDTSPEDMFILSKIAHDEAKHFWFLKEIVEDLSGHEADVAAIQESIRQEQLASGEDDVRPAELLEYFECSEDPLALAVYQYIAEGLAHRNWAMQAKCAPNKLIADRYAEIARDEKFHASVGRASLEKLLVDEATQIRAQALTDQFVEVLWKLKCIRQHIPSSELH